MIEVTYEHHGGTDLATVNSARVSFNKRSDELSKKDAKLVSYLSEHKHTSPFNHAYATFRVKAPIFVARQLVKHEYLPWNEVSRRYVDDEPEFYVPDVWRGRSADKKQGSEGVVKLEGVDEQIVDDYTAEALTAYQVLLEAGVAPEQARMVLPQSTMTEWWWSGTVGAWAKMCNLRCKPDTQLETRIVADKISDKMGELFPVSWSALKGY
jgi:thymidylate synthase (FAD)